MTGSAGPRRSAPPAPERVSKVAVGSRAEAKALRERAEEASRARAKSEKLASRARGLAAVDESEHRVSWTALDAGAVLVMMLVSLLGSDAVLGSRVVALMPGAGQALARMAVLGAFHLLQLGLLAFLANRHRSSLLSAFGFASRPGAGRAGATAVLVLVMVVVTRAATTLWGVTAEAIGWAPPPAGGITAVFGSGAWGLLAAIVIFVVLGPFAEELAFRGVVLRVLGERYGRWPAILGTAALFALYHFEPWTLVPLFVLGVASGWLAMSRRSLRAAIALHALYNGVVVGAAYWLAR